MHSEVHHRSLIDLCQAWSRSALAGEPALFMALRRELGSVFWRARGGRGYLSRVQGYRSGQIAIAVETFMNNVG